MVTQNILSSTQVTIAAKERFYTLIKLIGEDEYYSIWEATRSIIGPKSGDNIHKRRYRLHLLKESTLLLDPVTGIQAIKDEIRLLSCIYHKNCPYIEDAGDTEIKGKPEFFFAEHWWEGYTMKEIMLLAKQLSTPAHKFLIPIGAALWTAREIADALDHIHTLKDNKDLPLNMVHRNVKPENICYTNEGRVMLTGFSVSKSSSNLFTTVAGQIRGVSQYMAPERLASDDHIDNAKTDIFSLGCVLFEMIMGLPRMRMTTSGIPDINSIKRNVNMCALRKNMHPRLEKLINKMTAFEPEMRYGTAEEIRDEIDILLDAPPYRCFTSDIEGFVLYMLTQSKEGYLAVQRLMERESRAIKNKMKKKRSIINSQHSLKIKTPMSNPNPSSSATSSPHIISTCTPKMLLSKESVASEKKNNHLTAEQWGDIQKSIDVVLQSSKTQNIRKHKQTLIAASFLILISFIVLMLLGLNTFKKNIPFANASLISNNKKSAQSAPVTISEHLAIDKDDLVNSSNATLIIEINVADNASLIMQIRNFSGIKETAKKEILQQAYQKINSIDWSPYIGKNFIYQVSITRK